MTSSPRRPAPAYAARIIAGPVAMSGGLLGVSAMMAPGPVVGLIPAIGLIGVGIGTSWAFIAQRVMSGAKPGEETIAAASVATVQQAGIALGAATAGLIANVSGLGDGLHTASLRRTARSRRGWYAIKPDYRKIGPGALTRR